jgi:signal transduction histidine kinase
MLPALAAAPIAIMRLDFSRVAAFCAEQRQAGVTDVASVLAEPGQLGELLTMIDVVDVNDLIVAERGADRRENLLGPFSLDSHPFMSPGALVEQIVTVFEGGSSVRVESEGTDWAGLTGSHVLNWSAGLVDGAPDYSDVLVVVESTSGADAGGVGPTVHREQLEALIEIGGQLTAMLDPSVIFAKVLQTISDALQPTHAALLLVDQETESISASAGSSFEDFAFDRIMSGLAGRAMEVGVAVISGDISQEQGLGEPARSRAALHEGWSQIAAPIMSAGHAIGAILLEFEPGSPSPTAEAASFVATLAQQAAVAIKNAEMYGELAAGHDALREAHEQLKQTQTQLLSAQKMEAIGSLAAGIAHEINTPIQYVSDNVSFVADSAQAIFGVLDHAEEVMQALEKRGDVELVAPYRAACEKADLGFIAEEVPDALAQSKEGVDRVAAIVRAMKEFAHPGSDEKAPIDLNHCIRTTIEVAKTEWKYVADVDLRLDPELPQVPALAGPFNQTMLILLVNAAQALAEKEDRGPTGKGTITVSTGVEDGACVIRIADDGPGIPPEIADQIFDPFFTTKDVGKGSGQGLSIAHSVIFERHGGTIHAESEPGHGATFVIRLPLES